MDFAHLHLIINHVPILGSFVGLVLLSYGLISKNQTLVNTGLVAFVITGVAALFVFYTGEPAEEVVERIRGINEVAMEDHEEAAEFAIWLTVILAFLALAILVIQKIKRSLSMKWSVIPLILSIVVFGVMARVGYLGGQIRHTEFYQASTNGGSELIQKNGNHDEDDD